MYQSKHDVKNKLFEIAVHSGDNFRQWLYPNLPNSYNPNPLLDFLINKCFEEDLDSIATANRIYIDHC